MSRLELALCESSHRVEERRLHAREGEVEAVEARDRKAVRLRVALAREPVDLGAAGVAQAEQARALVERLPRRVVDRRAEPPCPAALLHLEQERVPSGGEQADEGRLDRRGLEVEGRDVAVEVVDRDERQPPPPRERLRGR